jgi:predicted aspartyl protease
MTSAKAWIALIGAALAPAFMSLPAWADDCGPLKQVMSLDMNVLPSGLSTVPVTINGAPRQMLFDTGGGISMLTQSAAESLGLHPASTRAKLLDVRGNASQTYVTLDSFVMGGAQVKGMIMMIAPQARIGNTGADGILAGDVMLSYDEEMDYTNKKLLYFMPDHCEGHVVHWTSSPATVIPFRRALPGSREINDTHIRFHVTMDGTDLLAMLDTGAARTTISAKVAEANFNVTETTPNTVPLGELDGRKVFGYVFKTISFGDVTVNNPHVAVLPDVIGLNDANNNTRADSRIKRVDDNLGPDITIGMDVIKQLHIYVAAKELKLYVTAAGAPAP